MINYQYKQKIKNMQELCLAKHMENMGLCLYLFAVKNNIFLVVMLTESASFAKFAKNEKFQVAYYIKKAI